MPSNVTMHQPSPRIIRLESNYDPSTRRQHRDIPPRWVLEVQVVDVVLAEDFRGVGVRRCLIV